MYQRTFREGRTVAPRLTAEPTVADLVRGRELSGTRTVSPVAESWYVARRSGGRDGKRLVTQVSLGGIDIFDI